MYMVVVVTNKTMSTYARFRGWKRLVVVEAVSTVENEPTRLISKGGGGVGKESPPSDTSAHGSYGRGGVLHRRIRAYMARGGGGVLHHQIRAYMARVEEVLVL